MRISSPKHDGNDQKIANVKSQKRFVSIEVESHPSDSNGPGVGQTRCLLVQGRESGHGQFVYRNVTRRLSNQIKLTHGL